MAAENMANRQRATGNQAKIYLTGFMGCGKSYAGVRLAERLGLSFVDLDAEIERSAGKTISDIFADDGETAFRALEAETLRATAAGPASVVATGGGAPCYHGGMAWMNEHGLTVFLDPPLAVLLARLEAGRTHRPLLQTGAALETFVVEKLAARRTVYEQARIQVTVSDPAIDLIDLLTDLVVEGLRPD
jgi:shikimate kinase